QTPKFTQRILNAVRDRVPPESVIDVGFEAHEGRVVAKVFVLRRKERVYSLGGRFYVRKGVESVFAEGNDITRLMEQYA
ncbi:MAG TPA: hypothetical protein VMD08_17670, partial [Candidatus Baltobacteraceae bacterium]|nr:hypothetical protein [Candidatus Baltobacteraceae bacterium]